MNYVDIPTNPTVLSLCAGIGGLDLGIGLAFPGARTIGFVEREAACCEILVSRMEEGRLDPAPIWTDVKTFDGRPWRGAVDILCAGYPCQPFSTAGRRKGDKDPRHLWPDIRRIIDECGPTYLVLENVQGHVSKGLREVLESLMELGYRCEWGVYSAAQAGAPHRRNRVFILAYSRSAGPQGGDARPGESCGEVGERAPVGSERADLPLAHSAGLRGEHRGDEPGSGEEGRETRQHENGTSASDQPSDRGEDLADTELQYVERCGDTRVVSEEAGEVEPQVSQLDAPGCQGEDLADPRGCGRGKDATTAQGGEPDAGGGCAGEPDFPPGPEGDWSGIPEELWPATESTIRGVAHGVPVRVDQLRALGNAVVPQQAALAIRELWGRLSNHNPVN